MAIDGHQPLVYPAADPTVSLRRQMLVSGLFKHVAQVEEVEGGYAFRFRRSELLTRRLADYIVFEGQCSPQLTFIIVAEANGGSLWLQVRGPQREREALIRSSGVAVPPRTSPPIAGS